jgi:hypothetical protein
MSSIDLTHGRAALVVAHPGHELRVYSWALLARPEVFILTDGSGHSGKPRLDSTTKILEQIRANRGAIYGRFTDRRIYSAIIGQEVDLFIDLVEELAQSLLREEMDYVVGDAMEGYNPAHDMCRLIINAAVDIASRTKGQPIPNFDILLTGNGSEHPEAPVENAIRLHLDEDVLARKLESMRAYSELTSEVESILEREGIQAIRVECLRPVPTPFRDNDTVERPYYEDYGGKQVAAGFYEKVLRYREHFEPLAQALRQYVSDRVYERVANSNN